MKTEGEYLLALQLMHGLGPAAWRKLLGVCGTATAFFDQGLPAETRARLSARQKELFSTNARRRALADAHEELHTAAKAGVSWVSANQNTFPRRLLRCPDHPMVLFYRGQASWNAARSVAIVGTRAGSARGKDWTRRFVRELGSDVVIVSGLALGIDAAAHKAALENGNPTWAVSARGLEVVYPKAHTVLAERIVDGGGCLTSEMRFRNEAAAHAFPRRNRIVAGLVDAVVVVESAEKGGSLITARLAQEYNREVYAVPGRPEDRMARGCLQLLLHHRAGLVTDAHSFRTSMGWEGRAPKSRDVLPERFEKVFAFLEANGPKLKDELMQEFPELPLSTILLEMECEAWIRVLPGPLYACA